MLKCIFAKAFRALSAEAFREAYEINFIGSVKSIQAAEKSLKKSENASIVLFSTVAVKTGMPFHAAVASAKGAIEGLSRSLAAEFAPQVRVNTIALSLTNTKMATRFLDSESKIKASEERHPMKQIGDPNDVSVLVEFLLIENAKWITGETIRVDGGIGTLKVP
ncbi:MAG: SDR family oxidoreductase [Bacteroidales bacterium]|nr:SDR family oxidoreductase [Bacteroidales bacterium]